MSGKLAVALLAIFVANYNNIRDSNEEEDRQVVIKKEYDFVVGMRKLVYRMQTCYTIVSVGAGNTGSVVATRLAQFGQSVLVVEAGQSGRGDINIDVPFYVPRLIGGKRDWKIDVAKPKRLDRDTLPFYPSGKVGGGSSALHYNVYIRGSEHDYRLWEDEGATGWNLQNLRKYFAKVEKATEDGMSDSLGRDGSVKLANAVHFPFRDILFNAANEIGIPTVDYLDGGGLKHGASRVTASVVKGKKQYALNSYLYPEMSKKNSTLDVAFDAHAHKILFQKIGDKYEAYGIIFNHSGVMKTVQIRKEIIVSGGFANSPKLLMLSGIGPKRHLKNHGIDVIVDVPGVGSNADGHTAVRTHFYGDKLPEGTTAFHDEVLNTFQEYEDTGNSPMSTVDLLTNLINIRSKYAGTKYALGSEKYPFPDINIHVSAMSHNVESYPDIANIFSKTYDDAAKGKNGTIFHVTLSGLVTYSLSKGTVRLKSSDPNDVPIYDQNYYANRGDFKVMKEILKVIESLESTEEFKKYGFKWTMIPDACIQYDKGMPRRGNKFYECYLKQMTITAVHSCSTCKMGFKNDTMAVVDSRLRMYAVSKVRVADASVFPHVTTANTQATCYVVGEKAADMIKEDWNIE